MIEKFNKLTVRFCLCLSFLHTNTSILFFSFNVFRRYLLNFFFSVKNALKSLWREWNVYPRYTLQCSGNVEDL